MIIDLRLDGFKHSLVELDNPKPISEIVRTTDISAETVLSYKSIIDNMSMTNMSQLRIPWWIASLTNIRKAAGSIMIL